MVEGARMIWRFLPGVILAESLWRKILASPTVKFIFQLATR